MEFCGILSDSSSHETGAIWLKIIMQDIEKQNDIITTPKNGWKNMSQGLITGKHEDVERSS